MKTKICTKCKNELPATLTFFHKDKSKKSGLRPQCKECRKGVNKNYYKQNKNEILDYQNKYSQTEIGKKVSRKSNKKYKQTNKGKLVNKKYQQSEKHKKAMKKYKLSEKGRAVIKKDNSSEKARERRVKYKKTHRGKLNSLSAKRRALKLSRTPLNADKVWIDVIYKIAAAMNKRAKKCLFHVDHIIPLFAGGLHHEDNLQILHIIDHYKKNIIDRGKYKK